MQRVSVYADPETVESTALNHGLRLGYSSENIWFLNILADAKFRASFTRLVSE